MDRDLFEILENEVFIYLFQTEMPLYRKSNVRETKSTIPKVVRKRGRVKNVCDEYAQAT